MMSNDTPLERTFTQSRLNFINTPILKSKPKQTKGQKPEKPENNSRKFKLTC